MQSFFIKPACGKIFSTAAACQRQQSGAQQQEGGRLWNCRDFNPLAGDILVSPAFDHRATGVRWREAHPTVIRIRLAAGDAEGESHVARHVGIELPWPGSYMLPGTVRRSGVGERAIDRRSCGQAEATGASKPSVEMAVPPKKKLIVGELVVLPGSPVEFAPVAMFR